jgi:Spy/CpxP family protein refolding chaperone
MTEGARRAFGLDDNYLLKWRAGGRSDKAKTLLFVAGVSIMILVGFKMLAGAPLPQYGGRRMRRPFGPDRQLARLSERLHLTDAQRAKIKPILEAQHEKMMALRRDTSLSREDRRARFRQIHRQTLAKIRPLLAAGQQKKLRPRRR